MKHWIVRRMVPLLLMLALLCGFYVPPARAAEGTYSDTKGHWAESSIERWSGYGVVQGFADGFRPNEATTRAQMAAILCNTLGLTELPAQNPFTDVPDGAWYAPYVLRCYEAGIMLGAGGKASPDGRISRQESMVMIARALGIQPEQNADLTAFTDGGTAGAWAAPYLAALVKSGIVGGTGEGRLAPEGPMTRAAIMAVMDRSIVQYINQSGTYTLSSGDGIILVAAGDVTLTGKTAADILVSPAAEGKSLKFDKAEVSGSITIQGERVSVTETGSVLPSIDGVSVKTETTGTAGTTGETPAQSVVTTIVAGGGGSSGGGTTGGGSGGTTGGGTTGGGTGGGTTGGETGGGTGGGTTGGPPEVTRKAWIVQLIGATGLEFNGENKYSSLGGIFDDLVYSASDTTYTSIEIAWQNGVLSAAADNKFHPEEGATEAFAAETAVRAAGLFAAAGSNAAAAPDYAALATEGLGFTAAADTPLTNARAEELLSRVREALAAPAISATPVDNTLLSESVVTLTDEPSGSETQADVTNTYENEITAIADGTSTDGAVTLTEAAVEKLAGTAPGGTETPNLTELENKCVILPATKEYPGGLARKITSVEKKEAGAAAQSAYALTRESGQTYTVKTEPATLNDLIQTGTTEIHMEGTQDVSSLDPANLYFEPDGGEAAAASESGVYAAPRASVTADLTKEGDRLCLNCDISGDSGFSGKVKLYISKIDYKADIVWEGIGQPKLENLYLALDNELKFNGQYNDQRAGSKRLGTLKVPLAGLVCADITLYLTWSLDGHAEIEYTTNNTLGIQYVNGALRRIARNNGNTFTIKPAEVDAKIGPKVSAALDFCGVVVLADMSYSVGLGGYAKLTPREEGKNCADATLYLYAELAAMEKSFLKSLLERHWTIWNKDNTVWRTSAHYEGTIIPSFDMQYKAVCTYGNGVLEGTVADAGTGATIPGCTVTATATATSTGGGAPVSQTGDFGRFRFEALPAGVYTVTVSADGYQTYTRNGVVVNKDQTTGMGTIQMVRAGTGSASGYVYTIEAAPISGATVTLTTPEGTKTATTDTNGSYSFTGIAAGYYEITVTAAGFATGTREITVADPMVSEQNVTLVPSNNPGDLRIVLTWGATPNDLDSHLRGPDAAGRGRFHVYYADKEYSANEKRHSFLDHDDVTSYGPETTTVYNINQAGTYSFYVHDYTNRSNASNTALANSGATVRVYGANSTPLATYHVPSGSVGTVWHVFDYNPNTQALTPYTTVTHNEDPGAVGYSMPTEEEMDIAAIFQDLKEKE